LLGAAGAVEAIFSILAIRDVSSSLLFPILAGFLLKSNG
jgi:3-oxoacyl-(acyl-carrier-protein) synthase